MTQHRIVFYEPGHFHAALTLRAANARLAPDIHVYATPGPERQAFVHLVESFQRQAVQPSHWTLHLHEGDDLLERLVTEARGDLVVLAGRNNTRLETIVRLTQAGFHVLADKPWLTDSGQLSYLAQATAGPRLAMDIMTTRYNILARLCHQVVTTPELFGTFVSEEAGEAAITIESVHHLYKKVNGRPLQRPAWYYDTTVQGDGMVDVQSHMVEQAQWWVLHDTIGEFERDVILDTARRWTTPVPLEVFQESTGLDAYPQALHSSVRDGVLEYACNGEIRYRLRGVSVRQSTRWRQREPENAGDLHSVTIHGSLCRVLIRQGPETGYRAEMHVVPAADVRLETILRSMVAGWQDRFPGLSFAPSPGGFRLLPSTTQEHGHESHFSLVLDTFLDYLDGNTWPAALCARIRMRYTLLARARELALRQQVS